MKTDFNNVMESSVLCLIKHLFLWNFFCCMCTFLKDNRQAQVVVLLTQFLQEQACSLEQGAYHDRKLENITQYLFWGITVQKVWEDMSLQCKEINNCEEQTKTSFTEQTILRRWEVVQRLLLAELGSFHLHLLFYERLILRPSCQTEWKSLTGSPDEKSRSHASCLHMQLCSREGQGDKLGEDEMTGWMILLYY